MMVFLCVVDRCVLPCPNTSSKDFESGMLSRPSNLEMAKSVFGSSPRIARSLVSIEKARMSAAGSLASVVLALEIAVDIGDIDIRAG